MTLKIRELIIRAEVSGSRPEAAGAHDRDSVPEETYRSMPESMTDRFFDDERNKDNER